MSFVKYILEKANLQALREYLLYGGKGGTYSTENYENRIKETNHKLVNTVKTYDAEGENSRLYFAINDILLAISVYIKRVFDISRIFDIIYLTRQLE